VQADEHVPTYDDDTQAGEDGDATAEADEREGDRVPHRESFRWPSNRVNTSVPANVIGTKTMGTDR
jgi:hypothetical protein